MVNLGMGKERSSISLTASPTSVTIGENITLSGAINVTHDGVIVYILHREVGELWTPLEEVLTNATSQYLYKWNTTASEPGTYEVKSYWLGDIDTYGNESAVETVELVGVHDVAVKNVAPSPIAVISGETVDIEVTVRNEGDYPETFDVHVYGDINTGIIGDEVEAGTIADITLSPGDSAFPDITWDTTGVSDGTYTISANASHVPGETNFANNLYVDDTVSVAPPEQPPVASFTYSPETPTTESVTFDASESEDPDGSIASYFWDFGDGTNATGATLVTVDHSYADNDTYTVTLNVTDNDGLSDATSKSITVLNRPPVASFTPSDDTVYVNQSITFDATDSDDPDGDITSYFWEFGDGANATGTTPTTEHSYSEEGNYTVILTVTDDDGATNSTSADITVGNRPPVAVFTESDEAVYTDVTISFNASESEDSDGSIVSYHWDFGDGANGTGAVVEHAYADDGTFTVTLTVEDDDGATDSTTADKTVLNRPPVANFTESAETAYVGEPISFNASDSYDPDGSIASYFWDFGDGSNATGATVDHVYETNGTFTVTLNVTDDDGASNSSASIKTILINEVPVAFFATRVVHTGEVVTFDASGSYDPDGSIASYFWDFGDGSNATGATVDHVYADDGSYTVTLTITDDDGAAASLSAVLTVLNTPPLAVFTDNATMPLTREVIQFNASGSSDPDGSVRSYVWDFGDGRKASGVAASHAYWDDGNYTVALTVTDDDGAAGLKTIVKTVLNRVPVAVFTNHTSAGAGLVRLDASRSYDPDGSIFHYFWDFGDGANASMAVILDRVYGADGDYLVTLTVTDDDGASASVSATVAVNARSSWLSTFLEGIAVCAAALSGTAVCAIYGLRKKSAS
jgi:PKD repeat protein